MLVYVSKVRRGPNPNNAIASLPISSTIDQSLYACVLWGPHQLLDSSQDDERDWFDREEKAIQKMRSYADFSSWNFQNKLLCCKLSSVFIWRILGRQSVVTMLPYCLHRSTNLCLCTRRLWRVSLQVISCWKVARDSHHFTF